MLFSSATFIYLFLPCVIFVYYVLLRKNRPMQNFFLFIASLFFYAWGEPKFVLLMLLSIFANWIFGLSVANAKTKKPHLAKVYLSLACVFDISLLFVFKYLGFTQRILVSLFGIHTEIVNIALPIGISFFTFQAMSYVIDVYRGKGEAQKNIINIGLYISFFPQLIAGPIVRYETVAEEIRNRRETADDFFNGFARFIVGLSKKVLLSNSFAVLADTAFDSCAEGQTFSAAFGWLGAIAYTLQIFFDFSGYSDMAIGLGAMFGFHFLENFNFPYISKSISEFWRRWHISLGTWFRDYLYFPLGGSRVKKPRLILNLFAVWTLTGIWHGANWTFMLWGFLYFVLIAFEKLTGLDKTSGRKTALLRWIYSMFFVIMGWVLFRSDSLACAWNYIKLMFMLDGNPAVDGIFTAYLSQYGLILAAGILFCLPVSGFVKKILKPGIFADILHTAALVCLFILCTACMTGSSYNPFIYFNF